MTGQRVSCGATTWSEVRMAKNARTKSKTAPAIPFPPERERLRVEGSWINNDEC